MPTMLLQANHTYSATMFGVNLGQPDGGLLKLTQCLHAIRSAVEVLRADPAWPSSNRSSRLLLVGFGHANDQCKAPGTE